MIERVKANVFIGVNQHNSPNVCKLFQNVVISPYNGPPSTPLTVWSTTGHTFSTRDTPKNFWRLRQLGSVVWRGRGDDGNNIYEPIQVEVSDLKGYRQGRIVGRV